MFDTGSGNYLFTWKSEVLSHNVIINLISEHKKNGKARFYWRCANHNAEVNAGAFFLSQEGKFRGLFAVGRILCKPALMSDTHEGKNSFRAQIEFDAIIDPYKDFLIDFERLIKIRKPEDQNKIPRQWRPRQSGEKLHPGAAREIRSLLEQKGYFNSFRSVDAVSFDPFGIDDERDRIPRDAVARRGQGNFRAELLAAYSGRCAVTGCNVVDLLEAAHIYPYLGERTNVVQNGLLLRADIHILFDRGLIGVNPENMKILIRENIEDEFYKSLLGKNIKLPKKLADHPSAAALNNHRMRHAL